MIPSLSAFRLYTLLRSITHLPYLGGHTETGHTCGVGRFGHDLSQYWPLSTRALTIHGLRTYVSVSLSRLVPADISIDTTA